MATCYIFIQTLCIIKNKHCTPIPSCTPPCERFWFSLKCFIVNLLSFACEVHWTVSHAPLHLIIPPCPSSTCFITQVCHSPVLSPCPWSWSSLAWVIKLSLRVLSPCPGSWFCRRCFIILSFRVKCRPHTGQVKLRPGTQCHCIMWPRSVRLEMKPFPQISQWTEMGVFDELSSPNGPIIWNSENKAVSMRYHKPWKHPHPAKSGTFFFVFQFGSLDKVRANLWGFSQHCILV